MTPFSPEQLRFLAAQRVGRLASADATGMPHAIPVCYACDGARLFIALDAKPKRVPPERLKRVRNILENPQVALVADRYSEDWSALAYLLIQGRAALLPPEDVRHAPAVALLRARYPQYVTMPIEQHAMIVIEPQRVVAWGRLEDFTIS